MISSVGNTNSYMSQISLNQTGRGPQGGDGFSSVDTDESGGVSSSELESFAATIEEATGISIDLETAMKTYDLDGDDQLSGDELFSLITENGIDPSSVGTGQGNKPPPPPPSSSSSLFSIQETSSSSESSTIEDMYAQLLEKASSSYESNSYSNSDGLEFLLNQMA